MDSSAVAHPWDGFLLGPENELAHASVMALARGGQAEPSVLVIYGPSGAGKSRLLAGLVAEWLVRRPDASVAHVAAEQFAAVCAEAAGRTRGWSELRSRFRDLELFVLEDLQALERASLALGELSHTLDALNETGAAVAFSARTGPAQWSAWPRRLVNRLSGGLVVRVDLPALATRRRYVLDRSRARGLTLPAGVVEAIADAADGFRTIDGLLSRLALDGRIGRKAIDDRLVIAALNEEGAAPTRVAIEEVAHAVAVRFGLRTSDLRSDSRRAALVEPRHLAILLARRWTGASLSQIGKYFGGRDPATIRHACREAAERLAADPSLAAVAQSLEAAWRMQARAG
jgi:chromosomal replication initiator protein